MAHAPQDPDTTPRQTRRCTHILTQSAIYLTAGAASLKGLLAIVAWLNSELQVSERDAIIVGSILAPFAIPYYAENIRKISDRAKESGFVQTASVIGGLLGASRSEGFERNLPCNTRL